MNLVTFFSDQYVHRVAYNLVHQQRIQGGLMIELEIQALSERREGLLVEVGHFVIANGFTLQRQRLIQDPHGILLTMVVRGPSRRTRALEAALNAYERVISFEITPFVEGEQKPHFAASRTLPSPVLPAAPEPPVAAAPAVATPTPTLAPATVPGATPVRFDEIEPPRLTAKPVIDPVTEPVAEPVAEAEPELDFEFILPEPTRAAPAAVVVEEPYVELIPLEPDQGAVDEALSKLASEYPQIMPRLLTLDRSVPEGARESSLRLAGQRVGSWVLEREQAQGRQLALNEAIEQIGVPTLRALVEVEQEGSQLHIRNSPLCTEDGHSGCTFFSGFLEGVLGPALASSEVTIFPVCCHSYGADDCVLALSD